MWNLILTNTRQAKKTSIGGDLQANSSATFCDRRRPQGRRRINDKYGPAMIEKSSSRYVAQGLVARHRLRADDRSVGQFERHAIVDREHPRSRLRRRPRRYPVRAAVTVKGEGLDHRFPPHDRRERRSVSALRHRPLPSPAQRQFPGHDTVAVGVRLSSTLPCQFRLFPAI